MVQTPQDRLKSYWPPTEVEEQTDGHGERSTQMDWSERLICFLGEHPGTTLTAAALVGLAVGWMVKRK